MRVCSSDRHSECGDRLAQGKSWTALGSVSKPWCPGWRSARPTELASKTVAQDDTDELDRTWEDQDERRSADERRTSHAENEVEGELVRGDGHGEKRLEASTNEEDG